MVYEEACQKMRESVSLEELQDNFEAVLGVLGDVQDAYRTYHGNACFAADKYPLFWPTSSTPSPSRWAATSACSRRRDAILVSYNSIFDETIRLNQRFFKDDVHAGGAAPRQ